MSAAIVIRKQETDHKADEDDDLNNKIDSGINKSSDDISNLKVLNNKNVDLLCVGFLRFGLNEINKSNINPYDVATIIIRMLGYLIYKSLNDIKYPYRAWVTPFVMHCINDNTFDYDNKDKLLTILGGNKKSETVFQSFECKNRNNNHNSNYIIELNNGTIFLPQKNIENVNSENNEDKQAVKHDKDLDNDQKQQDTNFNGMSENNRVVKHNDLQHVNIKKGSNILSFLIENDRKYGDCIGVINSDMLTGSVGYNLYCIDSDKWLFSRNYDSLSMFSNKINTENARALMFDQS